MWKTKKPVAHERGVAAREAPRTEKFPQPVPGPGPVPASRSRYLGPPSTRPQGDPQPTTYPQEQTSGTVLCASPQRHTLHEIHPMHAPSNHPNKPIHLLPNPPQMPPKRTTARAARACKASRFCKQQHVNWSQHRVSSSVGAMRHSKESPRGTCSPRWPFASRRLVYCLTSTRFLRGLPAGA